MHLRHSSLCLTRRFVRLLAVVVIVLLSVWALGNEVISRRGGQKMYEIIGRKGIHGALTSIEATIA